MTAKEKRRRARKLAGFCECCDQPNNGSRLCSYHRAQATVRVRERRQRLNPVKRTCSLCLGTGHNYTSCRLNADRVTI